jgi:hypothetical protein
VVAHASTGVILDLARALSTDVKNVPALREIRTRYLDPSQPPANTLMVAQLVAPSCSWKSKP